MKAKTAPQKRGRFPKGLDPYSGDQLVDFVFREFISLLENIIEKVSKNKNLKDPNTRQSLLGFFIPAQDKTETHKIFLEAEQNSRDLLRTFIHELVHALFHDRLYERKVCQLEKILWRRLTEDQKKILKSYIPRHPVKTGPPCVSKAT